jgi:hypothetical protein
MPQRKRRMSRRSAAASCPRRAPAQRERERDREREREKEDEAEVGEARTRPAQVMKRLAEAGFIAVSRCWAFGVRVRVRKAPLY